MLLYIIAVLPDMGSSSKSNSDGLVYKDLMLLFQKLASFCSSQCKPAQIKAILPSREKLKKKNPNLSQAIYLEQLKEKLCRKDSE